MLQLKIIFEHSNAYCVMLKAQSIMVFNFTAPPLMSCLLILTLIGLAVLIHDDLPVAILYSLVLILSLGALRNNLLFLTPMLKLSIYRSLAITTAEVAWIVQLLCDLRLPLPSPPKILCNNRSALFMAVNPVTRSRSKHIAIDYHFVRELIANGSLKVAFTPSHLQLADSFTKGVSKPQFLLFHNKLHVIPFTTLSLQGVIRQNPLLIDSFLDLRLFVIMYIYLFLVCSISQLYIHSI